MAVLGGDVVMKRFMMFFWTYGDDDTRLSIRSKEVLAPPETIEQMTKNDKARYFQFLVNDGEEFYISADCVISLTEMIERD